MKNSTFKKGDVTEMSKQARELRKLQAWLGLIQEDVALKSGTKAGIAHDDNDEQERKRKRKCKHGRDNGSNNSNSEMASIFSTPAEQSRAAIARTFTIGACYQIVSNKTLIKRLKAGEKYAVQTVSGSNDDPEFGFTFRYLGKQGIHHTFREISCGWGRTYTDAQLVGKEVIEVSEAEVRALRKSLMQAEVRF